MNGKEKRLAYCKHDTPTMRSETPVRKTVSSPSVFLCEFALCVSTVCSALRARHKTTNLKALGYFRSHFWTTILRKSGIWPAFIF